MRLAAEDSMNRLRRFGLLGVPLVLIANVASPQETPTYSNAQVVSIDPANRTMVIRTSTGKRESLVFDDLLAGTGGVKAGDRVIVTVRGGPGRKRVSAIALARTTPAAIPVRRASPSRASSEQSLLRAAFLGQVASISQNAQGVDSSWASFVTACKVIQPSTMSGSRDWFGLWDGRVQADYSSGLCRDLFNQIVTSGEAVKKAMASAESVVQGTLDPGEIREIRTLNNMNWDGWTLPAPARREP